MSLPLGGFPRGNGATWVWLWRTVATVLVVAWLAGIIPSAVAQRLLLSRGQSDTLFFFGSLALLLGFKVGVAYLAFLNVTVANRPAMTASQA